MSISATSWPTDLIGDGVIIAAPLEALAPPGGLCLSNTVMDQVRDRLGLDFLDLGEHRVKNIARPVQVYRVPLASEARTTSPFRGLEVFEFEHADIFHGRGGAIAATSCRVGHGPHRTYQTWPRREALIRWPFACLGLPVGACRSTGSR